jgi:hypothetical protein
MMKLVGGDSNTVGKPQQADDRWAVGVKQEAGDSSPTVWESVLH